MTDLQAALRLSQMHRLGEFIERRHVIIGKYAEILGNLPVNLPWLHDHTMGIGVAVASVALGATVIEKHFTLSRADGGVDSAFSMEPEELSHLVIESKRAWQGIGKVRYGPTEAEKKSIQYRRSLYITEDLKAGELLTNENVRSIRPGLGLPTKYLKTVLGRPVKCNVKRGTALHWGLI